MTRKAPASTDDGLVWFEVRAQRACGKVARTIPNWRVRETLFLVVLLVHVFGIKDGYSIAILLAILRTFGTKDSNMAQDMAK